MPQEIENILSLGVEIDLKHLESQVNDWNNSNKTCVFIKDGNCSIHDNKPLACIGHLVNSPAKYCALGSTKPAHMVRVKSIIDRLKILFKRHGNVILHEELYRHLSN